MATVAPQGTCCWLNLRRRNARTAFSCLSDLSRNIIVLAAAIFAALCTLNFLCIAFWEKELDEIQRKVLVRELDSRHLIGIWKDSCSLLRSLPERPQS
jgi:hypothetical protein